MSDGRAWRQFDIALDSPEAGGGLLVALASALPGALARGDVTGAFFMQKPPGIRLRLSGGEREVDEIARAIAVPGARFGPGIYEPETWLFDGPAGLRCAHDAFTADTLAVCAYAAAAARGAALAAPAAFSLALCEQLLARLGLDVWEAWDVWMRVLILRGGNWQDVVPGGADAAQAIGCEAILAEHALRTDRLAEAIAGQGRNRAFPNGIRRILPFWIVFHWNRMAFDTSTQRALAASVAGSRHPRARCEEAVAAWAR